MIERKQDYIIGCDIKINLINCILRTFDYLDCISSSCAKQFFDSPNKHSADYSFSSLIDHLYSSFESENLNVNVVDYVC